MTQQLHRQTNNRFAWLTPVRRRSIGTGRWMLCERDAYTLENYSAENVHITVNALLRLLATAFDKHAHQNHQSVKKCGSHIRSHCGRFEASLIRQETDDTRLFVQQRSDYFARMELHVDGRLLAAYQEPVWPHLQTPHPLNNEKISIPKDCVSLLESYGSAQSDKNAVSKCNTRDDQQEKVRNSGNTAAA